MGGERFSTAKSEKALDGPLGNFRLVDGYHPGGLANTSPKCGFQINHFSFAGWLVGTGFKAGNVDRSSLKLRIGGYASVRGTLVARHLHAFHDGVGDLGGK